MTDADTCTLCDLPTPDPPVSDEGVAGTFCCRGCLEVVRTLGPDAPADPAAIRESLDAGRDGARADADSDVGTVDPAGTGTGGVRAEDGSIRSIGDGDDHEEAFLAVEGMHCATCEAFLESRATATDGVRTASASYPAGLLKLSYDPAALRREDLPGLLDGLGYRVRDVQADAPDADDATGRLLVGGFFGMMAMLWYALFLYPTYLGVDPGRLLFDVTGPAGSYLLWNVWVAATVVLGYTGFPLLRGAYVSLRAGLPNMDLLVALAAGTAYLYSTLVLVLGGSEVYFDVSIVVVLAVTVGGYYEERIRRRAATSLGDLTRERVDEARRRTPNGTETVPIESLDPGDEVVVRSGERVPVDGQVVDGTGAVDESLVTGESLPRRVEPGDDLIGGSRLTAGGVRVAVDDADQRTLDRLVALLWEIQSARPGAQRLADRLAAVFVPLVLVLAVGAGAWHLLAGATAVGALLVALTVLIVSCPCALGLATPLAVSAGVRDALGRGIVVTDASVFERIDEVETVAFDKTGTLTTGEMRLLSVEVADSGAGDGDGSGAGDGGDSGAGDGDDSEAGDADGSQAGDAADSDEVLRLAAAVEQFADHPVATAVLEASSVPEASVSDFTQHPGTGVSATVDGQRVLVGRRSLFDEQGWAVPASLASRADRAVGAGTVPALVGWDGRARGVVVAGDEPRPGWGEVVSSLATDHRVVVITGDDPRAAARFRDHPAVAEVFAGVPPEAKAAVVERLAAEGPVAMVGDGSNDAPALAAADVGLALERGTRLAADAADAVVTTGDLATVPVAFDVLAGTRRRIRENLAWAFGYNAVAVPLAVVGLLNPLFAAVAMATSSLLVVANSTRSVGDTPAGASGDAMEPQADSPRVATGSDGVESAVQADGRGVVGDS